MKLEEVKSLFNLAGIPILATWELMNQYWPRPEIEDTEDGVQSMLRYGPLIIGNPWWR